MKYRVLLGALKATGHRGLQPAMDHLLENDGKPVPSDIGSVTETAPPARDASAMDEDDEDAEALRAVYGAAGPTAAQAAEAKVRISECICQRILLMM